MAKGTLKNPYLFDFREMNETMQEKEVEKTLVTHIKKFMLEPGPGFAYISN